MRKISRSLKVIGARKVRRIVLREGNDAAGIALRQQDQRELVAGEPRQRVVGFQQAGEPAREREQDRVADRDADGIVDLLEAVEIDHHDGRPHRRIGFGESEHRLEAIEEQAGGSASR